jgi:hypothetical protein
MLGHVRNQNVVNLPQMNLPLRKTVVAEKRKREGAREKRKRERGRANDAGESQGVEGVTGARV